MGYELEVYVWSEGHYEPYWQGENYLDALESMIKAKQEGYKCIKLEWRPITEG